VDLPDPDETATAKLYSIEFYTLLRPALAPGARLVVQAGSPYFAPRSYWCIEASLRAAGFLTTPYHVDVPSFGDWGFMLASPGPPAPGGSPIRPTPPPARPTLPPAGAAADGPAVALAPDAPPLRFVDGPVLRAATVFPPDRDRVPVEPSTLLQPRVLEYARTEWRSY
jgi:spermidine synthase